MYRFQGPPGNQILALTDQQVRVDLTDEFVSIV